MYARMLASWPEPVRNQLIDAHLPPGWWQAGVRERGSMAALADELKQGGNPPDVPVIVLATLGIDPRHAAARLPQIAARDDRRQAASLRGDSRLDHPRRAPRR
jgi:hypothetical protein